MSHRMATETSAVCRSGPFRLPSRARRPIQRGPLRSVCCAAPVVAPYGREGVGGEGARRAAWARSRKQQAYDEAAP